MPVSTDTITETEYFATEAGSSSSDEIPLGSEDKVADSFANVYSEFVSREIGRARSKGKPLPHSSVILSSMYGWAMSGEGEEQDSRDERLTRRFIRSYATLIEDFADQISVGAEKREDIVVKAVFNQRLAQSLFVVNRSGDYELRRKAEVFTNVIEALSMSGTSMGIEAKKALAGARAQAGAMKVLSEAGYQVIVPDTENEKEVETWDVLGMADFVAIPPWGGEIICVDVKGRLNVKEGGIESNIRLTGVKGRRYRFDSSYNYNEDRINAVRQIKKGVLDMRLEGEMGKKVRDEDVFQVVLNIPTDELYLSRLGVVKDETVADGIVDKVRGR
jgi:hypothetical protein